MEEKRRGFSPGLGGVLLLCVLLVLCLLTFAVLSVASAQADLRLSEKNAAYVKAYYAAANQAEAYFARADALSASGASAPDADALSAAFSEDAAFTGALETEDGAALSFSIPVGEDGAQSLETVILVSAHGAARARWEVVTAEDDGVLIGDDALPVWPGE